MSKKEEHLAKMASGTVTDALASVLGEDSAMIAWRRRVDRIKVDGISLAEHHARFKRPDDVIFHKQTHEAIMGADIIAGLGLDNDIVNITSQDRPDLILHFGDGGAVYADFTRACVELDEANNEGIRAVNRRLKVELLANPPVSHDGKLATPHITLQVRAASRIEPDRLYDEVLDWIRASREQFTQPGALLSDLGAALDWFNSAFQGHENVLVQLLESRDLDSLIVAVQDRITDKIGRYPERPLWLLISISESWANMTIGSAYVDFLKAAREGSLTFDFGDFDKIAVGVTGSSVFLKRSDGDQ